MAKSRFHVVYVGRATGVFSSWTETELLVKGFPYARHISFRTKAEAELAFEQNAARIQAEVAVLKKRARQKSSSGTSATNLFND